MTKAQAELARIQRELSVPKNQFNSFGGYNYRSCEDILAAVKKVTSGSIILSDEMVQLGDRFYVKATARLEMEDAACEAQGWAREALAKKGMDEAQITGSASSYARKYALAGLFALDDGHDPDSRDNRESEPVKQETKPVDNGLGNCPKCGSPLVEQTTKTGKKMTKCSTNGWNAELKQPEGCDYVVWGSPKPQVEEEDYPFPDQEL